MISPGYSVINYSDKRY